jgi:hypothetical protein
MPFDPRLIHPDDAPLRADGDLELPADLAALAEQLADDAAHLAARYPAQPKPQAALAAELVDSAERIKLAGQSSTSLSRGRALRGAALIAGAGLASIAAIGLTLTIVSRPLNRDPAVVSTPDFPRHETDSTPLSVPAALGAPASATLSLGELTAPEMEGLLDLLQRDPDRTTSISF